MNELIIPDLKYHIRLLFNVTNIDLFVLIIHLGIIQMLFRYQMNPAVLTPFYFVQTIIFCYLFNPSAKDSTQKKYVDFYYYIMYFLDKKVILKGDIDA